MRKQTSKAQVARQPPEHNTQIERVYLRDFTDMCSLMVARWLKVLQLKHGFSHFWRHLPGVFAHGHLACF
jgi:hypothetical protein